MRDLLLLAACVLWVAGRLTGQHRNRYFLFGFLGLAGLVGASHVGANTYRWQLVPAYVFLLLASFAAAARIGSEPRARPPKWRAVLIEALLILTLPVTLGLPLWLFPEVKYGPPSGPYVVGTRLDVLVDSNRSDPYSTAAGEYRRLLLQIWYPGDPVKSATRAQAHPDPRALARDLAAATPGMPSFLFSSLGRARTWTLPGIPVSGAARSFPLLMFSHGLGASRSLYGFATAELASHGYIVAAIEHTWWAAGTVFPDGQVARFRLEDRRVLPDDLAANALAAVWAEDGRAALSYLVKLARGDPQQQLTGRIDTTRIGYFGHSLGGATAANVMATDGRVLAGINLDGYLAGPAGGVGLDRPFLQVRSAVDLRQLPDEQLEAAGITRADLERMLDQWRARTGPVTRAGGADLELAGSAHLNYSDLPLWSPVVSRYLRLAGPISPRRAHEVTNALALAWFDQHLKGKRNTAAAMLNRYPELRRGGE